MLKIFTLPINKKWQRTQQSWLPAANSDGTPTLSSSESAQRCPGAVSAALSASQATASRKAVNHEQSQQLGVTTTETSEPTFSNQLDMSPVKPA